MRDVIVESVSPMSSSPSTFIFLLLVGGCAQSASASVHPVEEGAHEVDVWWAPELGLSSIESAPARLEQAFSEPFEVVTMKAGQLRSASAANCSVALVLVGEGYLPMSDVDAAAFKLEVAGCQVLQWLSAVKPAATAPLARFQFDAETLSRLPPALGPEPSPQETEEREAATTAGRSWQVFDPKATIASTDARHAKVRGVDWSTELDLMARGDFDGDGRDDIVVRTLSYGTEGSWREVRLHQLTADDGKAVLRLSRHVRW